MRLIEQTRCEGAKKGIMDAVKTIDGVLGREEEEGTENSNTANGKEIGRLVVGNSCFFATGREPDMNDPFTNDRFHFATTKYWIQESNLLTIKRQWT